MPRALLFSADATVSRTLRQVLYDLGLDVDSCADIFSTLEVLTSRDYEVIVADWDEGPEAEFLQKTTLEIKSKVPFFVFIVEPEDEAAALKAGADLILLKPLLADPTKTSLLTCDAFLGRMRDWLEIPEEEIYKGKPLVEAAPVATDLGINPADRLRQLEASGSPFVIIQPPSKSRDRSDLQWLGIAALVACTIAVYHFRKPQLRADLLSAVSSPESMNMVYEQAVDETSAALYSPGDDPRIKITPVVRKTVTRPRAATLTATSPITTSVTPNTIAEAASPVNSPAPDSWRGLPDSLHAPIPESAVGRNVVAAGVSPAVFDHLQPIELPEEMAARMLLRKVRPAYPEEAVRLGVEGPVVFQAWIARDGTIAELKLLRGPLLLSHAAYSAAKQWRFKPYSLNGELVEARTLLTVDFRLPVKEAHE